MINSTMWMHNLLSENFEATHVDCGFVGAMSGIKCLLAYVYGDRRYSAIISIYNVDTVQTDTCEFGYVG